MKIIPIYLFLKIQQFKATSVGKKWVRKKDKEKKY